MTYDLYVRLLPSETLKTHRINLRYVNVFLTSMFLWPMLKNGHRRVARRASWLYWIWTKCSTDWSDYRTCRVLSMRYQRPNSVCFFKSTLSFYLGWVCLASCCADVCILGQHSHSFMFSSALQVTMGSYFFFWAMSLKSHCRNRLSTVNKGLVWGERNTFTTVWHPVPALT